MHAGQSGDRRADGAYRASEVDYVDHFVWVIIDAADGSIAADGRFVRDADNAASAEIALTVADAYQGRGVGTLLLAALAIAAHIDGIEQFHAFVLSDNPAARALGDKFHARWEVIEPGTIATTMVISAIDDVPINGDVRRQIHHVARQVIRAFD